MISPLIHNGPAHDLLTLVHKGSLGSLYLSTFFELFTPCRAAAVPKFSRESTALRESTLPYNENDREGTRWEHESIPSSDLSLQVVRSKPDQWSNEPARGAAKKVSFRRKNWNRRWKFLKIVPPWLAETDCDLDWELFGTAPKHATHTMMKIASLLFSRTFPGTESSIIGRYRGQQARPGDNTAPVLVARPKNSPDAGCLISSSRK